MSTPPPILQRVAADRVIPLRHAVLRAGLSRGSALFAGDDDDATIHVAAVVGGAAAGIVVGCATYMREPIGDEPAWRLRGMASDPAWQGCGLGRSVLAFAESLLQPDPIRLRWCNARVPAAGFYRKQGWLVVSEEFDIPTAGPHVRMIRRLPAE